MSPNDLGKVLAFYGFAIFAFGFLLAWWLL